MQGMKVVELSSVLAGPTVCQFLAELGADVIKVENTTTKGDVTRTWKLANENQDSTVTAYFSCCNLGKGFVMVCDEKVWLLHSKSLMKTCAFHSSQCSTSCASMTVSATSSATPPSPLQCTAVDTQQCLLPLSASGRLS